MKKMSEYSKDLKYITDGFEEKSAALIVKSFELAEKAHAGQKRMSGDPYISHGIEVAKILKDMKMDSVSICAGFLHDVVEDTKFTAEDVKKEVGEDVAFLVEGVSQVTAKVFKSKGDKFSESLKKMFLAMAKDIRVIIIKLADRLHNMRTIQHLPEDRQKIIAQETMNVYAPLAHRLGMAKVKWELEDISFSILNSEAYRDIANKVAKRRGEREARIEEIKGKIKNEIDELDIVGEIKGRPKHFYSIYNKMIRDNKPFEGIFDLIAMRVTTDTERNCYTILGIIHNIWKPVPGRFKDYIAMPKQNLYQSLHTTVLDNVGHPIEIQIRTTEMDRIAEEGIAAHWNYKEDKTFSEKENSTFTWIRQLLDWNSSMRDNEDFLADLKVDLFEEEVFVFTPKGEVKELVKGSSVLDFAYSVHSGLGDKCIGAKVNGKWVTLKYELKNGDIIEILKGSNQHPSIDWLKMVKTTKAKNRIRHWLKTNQDVEENVEKGRNLLVKKLNKYNIIYEELSKEVMGKVLDNYSAKDEKDVFAGIGNGEFSEFRVANLIRRLSGEKEFIIKEVDTTKKVKKGEIVVQGEYSDIVYKFAKCCNPVPGDNIMAIFTKKGLSIHRTNCQNIQLNKITAPLVEVGWNEGVESFYMCTLVIEAKNRDGLINDVLNIIAKNNALVSSVNSNVIHGNHVESRLAIKVKGQTHIKEVMASIKKVKGIIGVERADA